MFEFLKLHCDDAIAHVELDRPGVLNAMHAGMRDELIECFATLDHDKTISAILISGAGRRAFCAGQDLGEAVAFGDDSVDEWVRHQGAMLASLRNVDKPVVVAFNGVATGAGFQLGLLADWRVGYPSLRMGQTEVKLGLASVYGSFFMSFHMGHATNQAMSLTGDLIDGGHAHALGLLNEMVPAEQVLDTARAAGERLACIPSIAMRLTKQRFRQQSQAGFEAACEAAVHAQRQAYASGEPQRRMQAFIDSRGT